MLPFELIYQDFLRWLKEDIPFYDITSKLLPDECYEAIILAKDDGIAVGLTLAKYLLERMNITVIESLPEGREFRKGDVLLRLRGNVKTILMIERTLLNILNRMCGIAKVTREIVKKAKSINPNIKIACTRKTTPGLRLLEKYAVYIGGGDTHRLSLSDMILIKDNHLVVLGNVEKAVKLAKEMSSFAHKIEIEITNTKDAIIAAKAGADIIMLDNMKPDEIKQVIEELTKLGLREKVILEASGNISSHNIEEYAKTGVDVISMGMLTHSVKSCNISLEVVKKCIKSEL